MERTVRDIDDIPRHRAGGIRIAAVHGFLECTAARYCDRIACYSAACTAVATVDRLLDRTARDRDLIVRGSSVARHMSAVDDALDGTSIRDGDNIPCRLSVCARGLSAGDVFLDRTARYRDLVSGHS